MRVLADIIQTTYNASGTEAKTLPIIEFGYGGTPERTLSDSGDLLPGSLQASGPSHLEWGRRHFDPRDGGGWPSLRSEVVDVDGDGFLDVIEATSAAEDSCATTAYFNASDGVGGHFGTAVPIARPQLPWENATPNLVDRKEGCSLGYQMNRRTVLPNDPEQQCGSMAANYNAFRLFDVTGDSVPELLSSFDYKPGKYNPLLDQAAMYPQGTPTCDTTVAPCLHSSAGRVMCTANHDPILPTADNDPYENPGGACGCPPGTCGASSCMLPEWGGATCPTFPCNPDECTVAACDRGSVDLVANLFQRSEQSEDGSRAWPGDAYSPGVVGWESASGVRRGMNQFCQYQAENACNQHVWRSSTFDRANTQYATPLVRTVPTPLESARATARMGSGGVVGSFHALIDLDGDRCPDSVYLPPPHRDSLWSGGLQVFRGDCAGEFRGKPDGQGGEVPFLWPMPGDVSRVIGYSSATSSPKAGPTEQRRTMQEEAALIDINGDGLPDYVRAGHSGAAAQVYFNNGAGFEGLPTRLADTGTPALIATLNREETVVVSHDNRGTSQIANGWSINTVRTHDLDVDGLIDVVRLGSPDTPPTFAPWQQANKTVQLHVNVGDYFLSPVSSNTTDPWWAGLARITVTNGNNWWVKTDVRDFNGDGLPDLFGGGTPNGGCDVSSAPESATAWSTCATTGGIRRDSRDGTGQGLRLLRSIENGRGARVEFEYGSMAKGPPFIQQANNSRLPTPVWFVVNMKVFPGKLADGVTDGPMMQTDYRYIEPIFNQDLHGQWGFRGFERVQEFAPPNAAGTRAKTARGYDYSVDYSGRLVVVAVWGATGDRLQTYSRTVWARAELFAAATQPVESFHAIEEKSWACPATGPLPQIEHCTAVGALKRTVRQFVPVTQGSLSYSGIAESDLPTAEGGILAPPPGAVAIQYVLRGERVTSGADNVVVEDRGVVRNHTLLNTATRYELLSTESHRVQATQNGSWAGYDLIGRSKTVYDAGNLGLPEETWTWNSPTEVTKTKRQFDVAGNVTAVQRPSIVALLEDSDPLNDPPVANRWSTIEFDTLKLHPVRQTDELGHQINFQHDYHFGLPTLVEGPNQPGVGLPRVATSYDGIGRVTRVERSIDSGGTYATEEVTRTTYFDTATPNRVETQQKLDYTSDTWVTREATFDGLGRPLTESAVLSPTSRATSSYEYDTAGNLISFSVPSPSSDSQLSTYLYEHDVLGRVTRAVQPGTAGEWQFVYDGTTTIRRQILSDQSEPMDSTLQEDAFGRLVSVTEARTGSPATATWIYHFDGNDNVDHITDANGIETSLRHDFVGHRVEVTRGGRTWFYDYDVAGNLVAETTPHSTGTDAEYTSTWVYDLLDRVSSHVPGSRGMDTPTRQRYFGNANRLTEYFYDESGHGSGLGRVTHVKLPFGRIDFDYSAEGWVTREKRQFTVTPFGTSYSANRTQLATYNGLGQPVTVTHPDGVAAPSVTLTTYDERGLARSLSRTNGAQPVLLAQVDRNLAGVPTRRYSGFAQGQTWSFDPLGRVTEHRIRSCNQGASDIATSQSCAQTGTVRGGETLTYFQSGNLESLTDPVNGAGGTQFSFVYDAQHQLTDALTVASGVGSTTYEAHLSYDPGGRILSADIDSSNQLGADVRPRAVTYDYPASGEQSHVTALTPAPGGGPTGSFQYDAGGNLTQRTYGSENESFVYDGDDQLREAILTDGSGEVYYYDHTGQRMVAYSEPAGPAPATLRFWFGATELEFSTAPFAVTRSHVFTSLGAMPAARVTRNGGAGAASIDLLYGGVLGSLLTVVASSTGLPQAQFGYGPFGERLYHVGPAQADYHRLFNGKEHDELTSLSYYGYRFYDRLTLTWSQADPLYRFVPDLAWDEPRRANLYSFSLNNPLRYLDPDGEEPTDPFTFAAFLALASGTDTGAAIAKGYAESVERDAHGSKLRTTYGVREIAVDASFEDRGYFGKGPGRETYENFVERQVTLGPSAFSSRIELAGTELHEALHGYVGGQDIDSGIDPLNDQIGAINHVLIYEAEAMFLKRGGAEKDTVNDRRQKKHQYLRKIKDPEVRKLVLQGRYAEAKKKTAEKSPSARFPKQPKSESPKPKQSRPQCDPPSSCPSPETK